MHLPESIDPKAFETFRRDPSAWRHLVAEVCAAHGLEWGVVSALPEGSNLVLALDDRWVVKIFPPFHLHQWHSEHRTLRHLSNYELPVKVPALVAAGIRPDRWSYVIIEKLPGLLLEACWDSFELQDKIDVLRQIGAIMAAVHRLPIGGLIELEPQWDSFLRNQKTICKKRHIDLGAPLWLHESLEDFVQTWVQESNMGKHVILTGEYTPFNLLVQRQAMGWNLTGMIDFGDTMVGSPEYDLLGPSLFSCGAEARLVSALFGGYFGQRHPISDSERWHFMALAALHRYANFDVQVRIPNWRERATSLETLARLIWPMVS